MSTFNDWISQFPPFQNIPQSIQDIISIPMSIATLIYYILLLLALAKAKNRIDFT